MITIVNYGVGNVGALLNMFEFIEHDAIATADPADISRATHLLLPGVGAFDGAMGPLARSGLIPHLESAVLGREVPILGVCLGMQLLGRRSDEGVMSGLGWIRADTVRMKPDPLKNTKVPFMGWAEISTRKDSKLFDQEKVHRFYFSHSYKMQCDDCSDVVATYGTVISAVQHKNIFGVQFHPEKSHRYGMEVLKNFVERSS
ncbi:imidazole glycerol phosphate synthase subunit HisH [Bradyrhizobium sp. I1.7.5]|uniref:imidazole glycerol phosphate synthase subunit HisH n=1 Tax=Bradyrhizobium sp. I1.7.5 TaxID=3156363 RepID=UPI00339AB50F